MRVTPSFFMAKMLARYGTVDGLKTCPSPWRLRSASRTPSTSVVTMGAEGLPKGVSRSCDSDLPERPHGVLQPRTTDDPQHRSSFARLRRPAQSTQKERARWISPAGPRKGCGGDLLSRTASRAVPSALAGLTSVFGMGTGVTLPK